MNLFFNNINFTFKCLGLKHSKFIGYKMQMIPMLGVTLYLFTQTILAFFSWEL